MNWRTVTEIPEPGFYWYRHKAIEPTLLVEVATVKEDAFTDPKSGFTFDAIEYRTVRLCEGLKVWPDRVIRFPSLWAGPLKPPPH